MNETALAGFSQVVQLKSLRGVDAAHLVLTDVDLSECLFAGTVHLDQLRLEGECDFAPAPSGLHHQGWRLMWWTPRRTLAEEHHWRADKYGMWTRNTSAASTVGPATLASVYRQLRKSLEDAKNEPDAADFYYGEMEMRRHDRKRPRFERGLLATYWALSGYGLRATRALGWLLAAMTVTLLTMMLWGLPADDWKSASVGKITGTVVTMPLDKPDPVNPTGPLYGRISTERLEKSLRVVLNSVIFRSSGQDLTTAGTYTEMLSRVTEPILLGLAVFAVRGRVKR